MCVNYAPVQRQVLERHLLHRAAECEWKDEAWPDYPAPIIRRAESGILRDGVAVGHEAVIGSFSMVPKGQMPPGVRFYQTANARAETIGKLSSFSKQLESQPVPRDPATGLFEPGRLAKRCAGASGPMAVNRSR